MAGFNSAFQPLYHSSNFYQFICVVIWPGFVGWIWFGLTLLNHMANSQDPETRETLLLPLNTIPCGVFYVQIDPMCILCCRQFNTNPYLSNVQCHSVPLPQASGSGTIRGKLHWSTVLGWWCAPHSASPNSCPCYIGHPDTSVNVSKTQTGVPFQSGTVLGKYEFLNTSVLAL